MKSSPKISEKSVYVIEATEAERTQRLRQSLPPPGPLELWPQAPGPGASCWLLSAQDHIKAKSVNPIMI